MGDTNTIQTFRKLVIDTTNSILSDVARVSDESNHTSILTGLDFITSALNQFPEIFIPPFTSLSTLDLKHSPASRDEFSAVGKEHLLTLPAYALTNWVISHLLRLLSVPGVDVIQNKIRHILWSILVALGGHNLFIFRQFAVQLIECLAELSKFFENFYSSPSPDAVKVKHFESNVESIVVVENVEHVLVHRPIVLKDPEHCQQLQCGITAVLCNIGVQLSLGVHDHVHSTDNSGDCGMLWAVVACQIEFGEVELKTISLRMAHVLLDNGLPTCEVLDYFINCVSSLVDLLCSGFSDCDGDFVELENALSDVVSKLTCELSVELNQVAKSCLIDTLSSNGIVQSIVTHGTLRLRTRRLPLELCRYVTATIRVNGFQHDVHFDLCDRLFNEVSSAWLFQSSKCIVRLLVEAVVLEITGTSTIKLRQCKADVEVSVNADIAAQCVAGNREVKAALDRDMNIASDSSTSSASLSDQSSVATLLINRLDCLMSELEKEEFVCADTRLDEIRVIIEVLACSSVFCCPLEIASRSSSPAVLIGLKSLDLVRLLAIWTSYLVHANCKKEPVICDVKQGYKAIVGSIDSLVLVQDALKLNFDQVSLLSELLSLPWLAGDMSWIDLKSVVAKRLESLTSLSDELGFTIVINNRVSLEIACFNEAMHGSDIYDAEAIAEGLRALSLQPKQSAPRWRKHVLCKASGDHRDVIRIASVCNLPFLVHILGPSSHHLIQDIIQGMMQDSSDSIKEAVASVVGSLACVISSSSSLHRIISSDTSSEGRIHSMKFQCTLCTQKCLPNGEFQPSGSLTTLKKIGESGVLLVPLVKAICGSQNKIVKLKLITELEQLSSHIWYWSSSSVAVDLVANVLCFLHDPDYDVRMAFCGAVRHVVAPEGVTMAFRSNRQIITVLSGFDRSYQVGSTLAETALMSVGEIARVAEGELLLTAVILLLNALLFSSSPLLEAISMQQMKQISVHRKISLRQLFMQFGRDLSKAVARCIHDTKSARSLWDPTQVLQKVADVFSFDDVQTFLKNTEHLLLPHLVQKATPAASSLIKTISRIVEDPNHKAGIVRTIGDIFCHLVCSCDAAEDLKKAITYIENELDRPFTTLLRLGNHIDCLLLIHLSESYEQVLNGMRILLKSKGCFPEGPDIPACNNEQLASLLQPNLLGILVYFDKHLNDGTIPLTEKRQAYKSLILLMKLMGSHHVTCVRMHVMTTLKIGLQFHDHQFAELCCEAWDCFVHILEVSVLGSMLSQIVVSLVALLPRLPNRVAQIFHFLIVENRENLHQQLHELYFLPDIPELSGINAVLRPYVDAMYSGKDLKTQIGHLLKGASHESVDVRQVALSKLIECLRLNKDTLHHLILNHETADPVISQLVTVLLIGCRETDLPTRIRFGQCLGEIGAIDPGRLELLTSQPKDEATKFVSSMCEDYFAFELINELAKAFLRAEDRTAQDCVAFAMQELIRIYDIRLEPSNPTFAAANAAGSAGSKLWKRFTLDVREILMPLTQSRYKLNFMSNSSSLTHPIYRSRKGTSFESWVCCLASYLGSKLRQEKCKRVFEACRGAIKLGGDSKIALFILPHVTLQVLIDANGDESTMLCQEIMAVLNDIKASDASCGPPNDLRHMASQTVFSVLDHLTRWARYRMTEIAIQHSVPVSSSSKTSNISSDTGAVSAIESDRSYREVKSFLDRVPLDVLAIASFNCGAYTRAFMHHEQFMRKSVASSSSSLDFLLKLYVALEEPDGVAGVLAIQQTPPPLAQQILAFESVGRLSDASVCYEHAIQSQPDELVFRHGVLRNQLALGELNSALSLANGMITDSPQWLAKLNSYRIEAAWRLGQWDKLQQFVKLDSLVGWNAGLGKLLIAAKVKDETGFLQCLQQLRQEQMAPLSAASMEAGSYQRGYKCIVRLHMLNELEDGLKVFFGFPSLGQTGNYPVNVNFNSLIDHWKNRLVFCQSSYRHQDAILNLRRIILRLAKEDRGLNVDQEIGQCWLQSARVARECGLIQTAHSSLLSAADYKLPEFCLEKAKWLWEKGDLDQAQSSLEKAIDLSYPDRSRFKSVTVSAGDERMLADRLNCANMLLQLGRYCDETASWESNAVVRQLKEVTQVHSEWEDGYFYVASYYDKVMMAVTGPDRPEKRGDFIMQVVQNFGQSLLYGSQYIYQSMPRMLSLWLDYGAEVAASDNADKSDTLRQGMRASLTQLNRAMASFGERLAPYQFLTVLPQLISRICHAHPDVFSQLKIIISSLLKEFPQQSMWMMMAVSKSSYPMRVRRCQEIFAHARASRSDLARFINDMTRLVDKLLDLCNRQEGPSTAVANLSITQHFKPLQRLLDDKDFSPVILPLQSQMTPILPAIPVPPASHIPFSTSAVYLQGLEDTVEVLASLQRPKKVTFRGSDGRRYPMLCKPKDDLRKDARLMEFNGIVNRCLRHDAESRRRSLHIRTFTVTALNEECGLLEWVLNTCGLRPILLKLYKERGLYMSGKELKALQLPPNAPLEKKHTTYIKKLLPRHPAIFGEWFLKTFPDPTSWYNARLAYCRTTAVMSMVGYILGLGDRHGENILVDSTTGDCVHVDFNCLFNKGETFDYPEIVPFRLTHNMVEAMGLLGYEGIFRRSCEVTLRVMRDQTDPLMSVLKTFIFDPLVEWSKPAKGRSHSAESGEIRNEKAQTHVNNIEDRLRGILKNKTKPRGLPLSVEGHVSHLIKEATDENNLCQMYIGWAAYM